MPHLFAVLLWCAQCNLQFNIPCPSIARLLLVKYETAILWYISCLSSGDSRQKGSLFDKKYCNIRLMVTLHYTLLYTSSQFRISMCILTGQVFRNISLTQVDRHD